MKPPHEVRPTSALVRPDTGSGRARSRGGARWHAVRRDGQRRRLPARWLGDRRHARPPWPVDHRPVGRTTRG